MLAIDQLVEYILKMPGFKHLSKHAAKKIIQTSKKVKLPKGWKYNCDPHGNKFFLILSGNLVYNYGSVAAKDDNTNQLNLRAFLAGEKIF